MQEVGIKKIIITNRIFYYILLVEEEYSWYN